eukprot:TRINITY_DN8369_c0_g1_i1.p1 TRINITY_DN8369_c0_g1~~TRINITY_DN8369_c0_g1_i1.p1  ORF type:complete len:314 (-),score=79.54 TRINITY_DN8369_c0_g1_i1:19-960(-)
MCEQYARELTKVAVAQICKDLNFDSISQSSCDTLADLLQRFIEEIGFRSHTLSELAGRTQTNFHDVRSVMKEMGFSIDDLFTYASLAEELPFRKPVPAFPLNKSQTEVDKDEKDEVEAAHKPQHPPHIPQYLPAFPLAHTYVRSQVQEEKVGDAKAIRKSKNKEKRQMETTLARLTEKLGNKPIINYDTAKRSMRGNPYLQQTKTWEAKRAEEARKNEPYTVAPTPIPRDNSILKSIQHNKHTSDEVMEDAKNKVYSELEESERVKKRQRAEQILNLEYQKDMIDQDLPGPPGTGDKSEKAPSRQNGPAVERM